MDLILNYGLQFQIMDLNLKLWTFGPLDNSYVMSLTYRNLPESLGRHKDKNEICHFFNFILGGLKFQSSELSPPWLSAAGAFFFQIFAFFIFWRRILAKQRDF